MEARVLGTKNRFLFLLGAGAIVAALCFFLINFVMNTLVIRWVNENYPPRSSVEVQKAAVASSYKALSEMKTPSVAFTLSADMLAKLLTDSVSAVGKDLPAKIDHLSVSGEQQQVRISTDFEGHFSDYDATVKGKMDGTAAIVLENDNLVVTPTFDRIQVSELSVSGWHLPGTLSKGLGVALSKFLNNYNGELKPSTVEVAKELLGEQKVELGGKSFIIPAQQLVAQSVLVDGGRIFWMGQINGNKAIPTTETVSDFGRLKSAFTEKGGDLIASAPKDGLVFSRDYMKGLVALAGLNLAPADRAKASLEAAWTAVHQLAGPDASVVLPLAILEKFVMPPLTKAIDEQAKKSKVAVVEKRLDLIDGRLGVVVVAKAELPEPTGGSLTFKLGVGVSPLIEEGKITLLPSIDEISIQEVASAKIDAAKAVTSVNAVISGLVSGLNQVFPAIPVEVKPFEIEAVDLKKSAEQTAGLVLSPDAIPTTQARFAAGAVLVTAKGIQILADFDVDSQNIAPRAKGADPAPFSGSVADIEQMFTQRREATLAAVDMEKATIDVSWARLAQIVNAKWKDLGGIKASYSFDTGSQAMEPTEIRLVDKPTYTCEQKNCEQRSCSFNSCAGSCSLDSCDWGCGHDVGYPCPTFDNPGRWCTAHVPDPVCEANKLTCLAGRDAKYHGCRAACDIKANADKGLCDTAAVAEKAKCDAEAAVLKGACDLGNAIQEFAQQIGGIGSIGGDARAVGDVTLDATSLALSEGSPGVTLSPAIFGKLTASGSIDFTPYDIGHLLVCPAKGKAFFTVGVDIPGQQPSIQAALQGGDSTAGLLRMTAVINSFNLKAQLNPSPAEAILVQNPQLLVECNPVLIGPTVGLAIIGKARGLNGNDLIKAAGKEASAFFAGDVDYEVKGFNVPIDVKIPELVVGGQTLTVHPKLDGRVVGASFE
ncbi:hypothetical protein O9X98_10975 [Agrobacterium salinitolerans]|nr:hypothetical protein [Agrobacterium salinitolerans]